MRGFNFFEMYKLHFPCVLVLAGVELFFFITASMGYALNLCWKHDLCW